ncbi:ABC transporter ATP-binding protein, partial [Kibdelosporangium lantanae]
MDGAWGLLMGAARSVDAPKGVRKGTMRRVLRFARPHRGLLIMFLVLTVASSVLAVTTPLLAGQVVNAIVGGHEAPWITVDGTDIADAADQLSDTDSVKRLVEMAVSAA